MNRRSRYILGVLILLLPLLAACGAPATAQQEPPTPTPLPPDTALERQTYTVQLGTIERVLEINGRVTPVDLVRLSFHRDGRVEKINVKRGDTVKGGDVLAELQQDEVNDDLRSAEDNLVEAQRALSEAKQQQVKAIRQATLTLQNAQEDLTRLLPGGEDDPIRTAQRALEAAIKKANTTGTSGSEAKTNAEYALGKASEALQDGQQAYSKAFWNNDWVQRFGTDPDQPYIVDSATGKRTPNTLTDAQKAEFQTALIHAAQNLRDLEHSVELAQREVDKAHEQEISQNEDASQEVQDAQHALDLLLNGKGSRELVDARRGVETAQLGLAEAQQQTFTSELSAIDAAQRAVDKARKQVTDGQVIAPQSGEVLSLAISEGDEAQAFTSVIEIADPSKLELAADLPDTQMRQLAEGQPADVSLLSRPDVLMPGVIRRLPAPYGSGGSGAVQEEDHTTRFQVNDTKGQTLTPGAVAKIRVVLEHKENVLWLPPEAVRAFEGRRFVVVREGDRERRVTVKVGIETEDRVEILEGVKQGDLVVGQ